MSKHIVGPVAPAMESPLPRRRPAQPVFYSPGRPCIIDHAIEVDGLTVSFYERETLEQMRARYPDVVMIEWDEAAKLIYERNIRPVEPATEAQYNEALCCLPPNQWITRPGEESFKMSEHYSGAVTSIYARIGSRHFHLADDCDLPHAEIIRRCVVFVGGESTK